MGLAIANNLINEKSFKTSEISVLKPTSKNQIKGVKYYQKSQELSDEKYIADVVFIAVKPQNVQEVLEELSDKNIFDSKTIFISILAGKKIEFFTNILGKKAKIIRSMPNMPIIDSQGILLYQINENINKTELKKFANIFAKFGFAYEIKDEKLFDPLTAMFGSGPAYLLLFQDIICEIATKHNVKKEDAISLVKQLFLGTSLMSCNSDLSFRELKENITSKAGTTASGLSVFENEDSLKNLTKLAIDEATKRSKELSN